MQSLSLINVVRSAKRFSLSFLVVTKRALGRAHNLRQRSSDDSVNETILNPRLAVAARRQWDFPDVKFRVASLIRYRRKQSDRSSTFGFSGSGIRTMIRIVLKS